MQRSHPAPDRAVSHCADWLMTANAPWVGSSINRAGCSCVGNSVRTNPCGRVGRFDLARMVRLLGCPLAERRSLRLVRSPCRQGIVGYRRPQSPFQGTVLPLYLSADGVAASEIHRSEGPRPRGAETSTTTMAIVLRCSGSSISSSCCRSLSGKSGREPAGGARLRCSGPNHRTR